MMWTKTIIGLTRKDRTNETDTSTYNENEVRNFQRRFYGNAFIYVIVRDDLLAVISRDMNKPRLLIYSYKKED